MTTKEFTNQLRLVADWTDAHDAGNKISGAYPGAPVPMVFLKSFEAMRELFAGRDATRTRDRHRSGYDWSITVDGIVFRAAEYGAEPVSYDPETRVL